MMLNGELEVERYCEEIVDGDEGVKRIHGEINMADIFLMTIGKKVRGYMRRTKGRG